MSDRGLAECGVRRAFLVEQKEGRNKIPPGLGFTQINYGRLFIRDRWVLFAIARELDCTIEEILESTDTKREGPRWSEIVQASEEILEEVRTLPGPLRDLITLRGSGVSWKRVKAQFPGRLSFSLRDDHSAGMDTLLRRCFDHLNFLASYENFFVVKAREAA